jgi:hypothetical protein
VFVVSISVAAPLGGIALYDPGKLTARAVLITGLREILIPMRPHSVLHALIGGQVCAVLTARTHARARAHSRIYRVAVRRVVGWSCGTFSCSFFFVLIRFSFASLPFISFIEILLAGCNIDISFELFSLFVF